MFFAKSKTDVFKPSKGARRFLTKQLVRQAITVEFKRSFVGLTWLFLAPLFAVIIWVLLHSVGVLAPGETGIPYPAYVLLSTSIWSFFADIYGGVSNLLISNTRVLLTTAIPIEVLVFERIIVHLIRFSIPLFLNILVLLLFGVDLHWLSLLFPFTLFPLLLLGTGLGMLTALFRIVAVDLARLADQGIGFLMFLTPIIYAPKIEIAWLGTIIHYNPLTYLIGLPRDLLTQGSISFPGTYLFCGLLSLLFFLLSFYIFWSAQKKVLERLINN